MIRSLYHFLWAFFAALFYRFPSRRLSVIGATGTKGKTTVTELIGFILEAAGFKTAVLNSYRLKIGAEEKINKSGMTMPGRGAIQKFLRRAVLTGCRFAVLEVTSQGVLQHRHRFISFDAAVFTNLAPEHLEAHSGFENYREAKLRFFRSVAKREPPKKFFINSGDKNAGLFAKAASSGEVIWYSAKDLEPFWGKKTKNPNFAGFFNLENAAAAAAVARSYGVPDKIILKALDEFPGVAGRMEFVQKEPFAVVVDYAHTPDSLRKAYAFLKESKSKFPALPASRQALSLYETSQSEANSRLICVLGAAGGGRDKWKRPEMGKIAAEYCNEIILTNEDPYNENPNKILLEIKSGIQNSEFKIQNLREIINRGEAIEKAVSLADERDVVIITGKGSEPWLHLARGKKIPWSDKGVALEALKNIKA